MLGKLNHIAIAVPNIKEAAEQYKNIFGAKVSDPVEQPDHGVTTVFIDLGNTKIELLEKTFHKAHNSLCEISEQ